MFLWSKYNYIMHFSNQNNQMLMLPHIYHVLVIANDCELSHAVY